MTMAVNDLRYFDIYVLYFIIFVLAIINLSFGMKYRTVLSNKVYEVIFYINFVICFGILQILNEVFKKDTELYLKVKDISFSMLFVIILLIGIYDMVVFKIVKNKKVLGFTDDSIKEFMDTLPVGVAFSDKYGRPYLVNYKIEELSLLIFGRNVLNTLDFFDEKSENEFIKNNLINRFSKDNIIIKAGGIWQIENIYHGDIIETVASDVTEEYALIEQMKEKNEKIKEINKNLKVFNKNIDSFIREKELLEAKRKIHDDIGRSLILFRMYMEDENKTAAKGVDLINLWKQNITLLKGGLESENNSSWDRLYKASKSAGLEIKITGQLPRCEKTLALLTHILHEAINNAILHGQAKTLFLNIVAEDLYYKITITNDGIKPVGKIVEKGGLKNIRRLVEMEGGTLEIRDDPCFVMDIVLRKEVNNET